MHRRKKVKQGMFFDGCQPSVLNAQSVARRFIGRRGGKRKLESESVAALAAGYRGAQPAAKIFRALTAEPVFWVPFGFVRIFHVAHFTS